MTIVAFLVSSAPPLVCPRTTPPSALLSLSRSLQLLYLVFPLLVQLVLTASRTPSFNTFPLMSYLFYFSSSTSPGPLTPFPRVGSPLPSTRCINLANPQTLHLPFVLSLSLLVSPNSLSVSCLLVSLSFSSLRKSSLHTKPAFAQAGPLLTK